MYLQSGNCLLVAKLGDEIVGLVGLRQLDTDVCEMKRLFVMNAARRKGIAEKLVNKLIEKANEMKYKEMKLDSVEELIGAKKLYEKLNFKPCEPYYNNPWPTCYFLSLKF